MPSARMVRLHGSSADRLEITPNPWAGVGLVRVGTPGAASFSS
ncbi:hypothetical protein AB0H49_04745 [Nocardia sp. NPDC050713]